MTNTRDMLIAAFAEPEHGSPAETLFWAGLRIAGEFYGKPTGTWYEAQAHVGPYRVDFLFDVNDISGKLVVEIDGHQWHERTKEQATKDRTRDRWLVEHDYQVIRFTGSEVWANPVECGREVLRILGAINGR